MLVLPLFVSAKIFQIIMSLQCLPTHGRGIAAHLTAIIPDTLQWRPDNVGGQHIIKG